MGVAGWGRNVALACGQGSDFVESSAGVARRQASRGNRSTWVVEQGVAGFARQLFFCARGSARQLLWVRSSCSSGGVLLAVAHLRPGGRPALHTRTALTLGVLQVRENCMCKGDTSRSQTCYLHSPGLLFGSSRSLGHRRVGDLCFRGASLHHDGVAVAAAAFDRQLDRHVACALRLRAGA